MKKPDIAALRRAYAGEWRLPAGATPVNQVPAPDDPSNGYDAVAQAFMAAREQARIGAATVRAWSLSLSPAAAVLDLGCGHGVPVAQTLLERGCTVFGIDASPAMLSAFARRFPDALSECATVEDSTFFGRRFDGVVACGLLFLLPADVQVALLHKVASVLVPGGQFMFTAPARACSWQDSLTASTSLSLGAASYRQIIAAAGLAVSGEADDEGQNHYYFARRRPGRIRQP